MIRRGILSFLALSILSMLIGHIVPVASSATGGPPPASYILGPEDVLEINVWPQAELTRTVTVRPDGRISFPPLGELQAGGAAPQELGRIVASRLQPYVKNPIVTVVVVKEKGKRVSVLGQVRAPGHYVLREQAKLTEAISVAGGTTFAADLSAVVITGDSASGQQRKIAVNLERILKGEDLDSNLLLRPNDVVFVPGTLRQGLEALRQAVPTIQIQIQVQGQGP